MLRTPPRIAEEGLHIAGVDRESVRFALLVEAEADHPFGMDPDNRARFPGTGYGLAAAPESPRSGPATA
ncbi:hypothetical protein nbrc107697_30030 [Gordonia crocea]|uniref:Uncharacterized protein n=1 Tax=Gordonia crocea TaxID=589162 RepID=A0A7I9V0I4_9ACTN|nr:hypothetical protein nbrc107697_30030 [Gordonia crocea]